MWVYLRSEYSLVGNLTAHYMGLLLLLLDTDVCLGPNVSIRMLLTCAIVMIVMLVM